MKFIKIIYFVFLITFQSANATASGPGTTSANFLKIPVGARQTAIGSAFVAIADDVNAIYYNPAGLAQLNKNEITFVHNKYFEDISQQWFAGAFPVEHGVFGFGLNYLYIPGFDAYDNDNRKTGSVSSYDMAVNFSYARQHNLEDNDSFSSILFGVNLKYLIERLDTEKASGFGTDLGVLFKLKDKDINIGFAVDNLISNRVKFIEEGFKPPLKFKTGISYKIQSAKIFCSILSLDWNLPKDGDKYVALGMENILYNLIAIRVGYNSFGDISQRFNVGVGFKLSKAPTQNIEVDYSFSDTYDFGNIHKIGILYRFGNLKESQISSS